MTSNNTGTAILIIGIIYLVYRFHITDWWTWLVVGLALILITYPGWRNYRERIIIAQARYWELKVRQLEMKLRNA